MSRIFALLCLVLALFTGPSAARDAENTLYMDLPSGRVVIEMLPDVAPKHVARIKELTRKGFYDGTPFHRVIEGFMAQGGDPTGTGAGGSGQTLPLESSEIKHERGIVSMARGQAFNSADSQFFIMYDAKPHLDRMYTVWGRVVEGMEHVDAITKGDPAANGAVTGEPTRIIRMQVAADAKDAKQ